MNRIRLKKKRKKKKGGGCKVELAGFVIPRIFAKWGRNGRLVEIMGHEATSERDEPLTERLGRAITEIETK